MASFRAPNTTVRCECNAPLVIKILDTRYFCSLAAKSLTFPILYHVSLPLSLTGWWIWWRILTVYLSHFFSGSYGSQRLAGKMCLFFSYQLLSTTLPAWDLEGTNKREHLTKCYTTSKKTEAVNIRLSSHFYEIVQYRNSVKVHIVICHHIVLMFCRTLVGIFIVSTERIKRRDRSAHLVFLHRGIVHQSDIIMDVEAKERTWVKKKQEEQQFRNKTLILRCKVCAEKCLGSLTRFPSGFGDNEVVKTVVLRQTDRQKRCYVNKDERAGPQVKNHTINEICFKSSVHRQATEPLAQLSYLRIKRDEAERITTEWSGEASGTHMWDYQVLLDVHQLLHSRGPAHRENKV